MQLKRAFWSLGAQMSSLFQAVLRRKSLLKRFIIRLVCTFVSVYLGMLFFPSFRNLLLYPILPGMWREIPSLALQTMYLASDTRDVGACPRACAQRITPNAPRPQPRTRAVQLNLMQTPPDARFYEFMPSMSTQEKLSLLHATDVLVEVLESLNVEYFLTGGTLLGVVRHRGVIPWDGDVDVAVSSEHWARVKAALCCIEGLSVSLNDNMHWKFYHNDSYRVRTAPDTRFPFVDVFFYDEDDTYIWSVNDYTRPDLLTTKANVFPLTTAIFEGKQYKVPRLYEKLINLEFGDLSMCMSTKNLYRYNHGLRGSEVITLPCSELSHMYTFSGQSG